MALSCFKKPANIWSGDIWCNIWRIIAVKNLSTLLRGITSNHNGDFYCFNCSLSYSTKNRLKNYERLCNDHDDCHVEMLKKDKKVLQHKHGGKSLKVAFLIYADLECLLKKCILIKIVPKNLTQT